MTAKRKALRCVECLEPVKGKRDITRHAKMHQRGTDGLAVEVPLFEYVGGYWPGGYKTKC